MHEAGNAHAPDSFAFLLLPSAAASNLPRLQSSVAAKTVSFGIIVPSGSMIVL